MYHRTIIILIVIILIINARLISQFSIINQIIQIIIVIILIRIIIGIISAFGKNILFLFQYRQIYRLFGLDALCKAKTTLG